MPGRTAPHRRGIFRKAVDKRLGFPADRKQEKARLLGLIARSRRDPGFELRTRHRPQLCPPPATPRKIGRSCGLLHPAAPCSRPIAGGLCRIRSGGLHRSRADCTTRAQRRRRPPTDAALGVADGIRHLLVDEFQDTSRRQHQLLRASSLPGLSATGRTCFVVGDPMQSIYFFREADAELFPRVKTFGLEIPTAEPLLFDFVSLTANFRTTPPSSIASTRSSPRSSPSTTAAA